MGPGHGGTSRWRASSRGLGKGRAPDAAGGDDKRVIVGTWQSRADWEALRQDPTFTATAARLDALQAELSGPQWHEVIADVISPRPLRAIQAVADKSWETTTRVARRITGRGTLRRFQTARDRLRK